MKITPTVKEFIENYIDLIEESNYVELFSKCPPEIFGELYSIIKTTLDSDIENLKIFNAQEWDVSEDRYRYIASNRTLSDAIWAAIRRMSDYGVTVEVGVKGNIIWTAEKEKPKQVSDTKGIGKFYGSDGSVYEVEYDRKVLSRSDVYEYRSQRKIK